MVEFFKSAGKLRTLTLGDLAVMQALECNEIWNLYNGVSLCYSCHKTLEEIIINLVLVLGSLTTYDDDQDDVLQDCHWLYFVKLLSQDTNLDGSGQTILRLENFKSTNGPNVHLYLATDKVASNFIDLGRLKANNGNQNYNIPVGTDLAKYNMALIWCKDFSVLFGSAQLKT